MANIMKRFGPSYAAETAECILGIDKFFDCCNVRNTKECTIKGKPFLTPYKNQDDERFKWLENDFLRYFENWKNNIENRTANDKCKMLLSRQTYEGLQITTLSIIECVKSLLQAGFPYVLTNKLCQDDLENYFGKKEQSATGRTTQIEEIQVTMKTS